MVSLLVVVLSVLLDTLEAVATNESVMLGVWKLCLKALDAGQKPLTSGARGGDKALTAYVYIFVEAGGESFDS
jgi:hypothetical protein